ncbi:MAG: dihydroorotate dehydrogenase electron transfer subunit [Anaerolineae bacterium]|nr:dihydroorotate dehydrogenase electron transfer subunit [Anaerolineae bacterium]
MTYRQDVTTKRACLLQALRIVEIKVENATTKTFVLDGSLPADPGQFVMAWLPGLEDKPFSLANANPITLTIAAVGPFSRALFQLQVGDFLWVRGPLGHGFQLPTVPGGHVLLMGGGYGVAPLLFLACQALAANCQVSMIIGARSASGLLLAGDFEAIGVSLWLTTEDGSAGQQGVVTDAVPQVIARAGTPQKVYACGPTGMLAAVGSLCEAKHIPVQLSWEAHMRCGIGLCGSCEVGKGWLTCLDGPVFPFNPLTVNP